MFVGGVALNLLDREYIIKQLELKYPNTDTKKLADELRISIYTLRRIVSKHNIKKSKDYLNKLHNELMQYKKISFEDSIKAYPINNIERNIIIGSLLGDGSLALYERSKNAYYREHGGDK